MNDATAVRGVECPCDLRACSQRFVQRNRTPLETFGQGRALDQLHHEERHILPVSRRRGACRCWGD